MHQGGTPMRAAEYACVFPARGLEGAISAGSALDSSDRSTNRGGTEHVGRLVVVSNRVSTNTGSKSAAGGLTVAMQAALGSFPAIWFGWSGNVVEGEPTGLTVTRDAAFTRIVTDLNKADYERYYKGFANRSLWPLFHYRIDLADFDREDYEGYNRVNELFARSLMTLLQRDDIVWVHDYHLIPLGAMLRRLGARQRIGFFLHTPFPVPEVLTTLPVHEDIIRSLCAYDVVGFQTGTDLRAFFHYVIEEAGGSAALDGEVRAYGRSLRAAAFPISIDTAAVAAAADRAARSTQCRRMTESLAGRSLIIGVDRLDYTKGLIQRLEAIKFLLEAHRSYRAGVVFLQIAPASRGDVPEYQQIRASLDARVGRINGRFAEFDRFPVRYLNKQFGQETLFGFYRVSRVGLVTPLRDGMNLVAKEFVASQDSEDPGVLVLSRFAGAARELGAALVVNPYDPVAVADALHQALEMPQAERRERHEHLMRVLRKNDIRAWRDAFIGALMESAQPARRAAAARSLAGHGL